MANKSAQIFKVIGSSLISAVKLKQKANIEYFIS